MKFFARYFWRWRWQSVINHLLNLTHFSSLCRWKATGIHFHVSSPSDLKFMHAGNWAEASEDETVFVVYNFFRGHMNVLVENLNNLFKLNFLPPKILEINIDVREVSRELREFGSQFSHNLLKTLSFKRMQQNYLCLMQEIVEIASKTKVRTQRARVSAIIL